MLEFKRRTKGAHVLEGVPSWFSDLLHLRGIDTEEKMQGFLHPSFQDLYDPFLFPDMQKIVDILRDGKEKGKRVVVYGDYDVDGICSSVIMHEALTLFGLDASIYIPDRHKEGYGLNEEAVIALSKEASILVTVDCGITSVLEVAVAKENGMTVIVTDHHRLPPELPKADALLNPLLHNYPFPFLCGAGVAFKVYHALHGLEKAKECLDLTALATVADMVTLLSENRLLVSEGLKRITNTKRTGLRALIEVSQASLPIKSEHVSFLLAPRLNATGRLDNAMVAVSLLQETSLEKARIKAEELDALNQKRKDIETAVYEDVLSKVAKKDLCQKRAIVIAGEGYESGVVGLCAGRLAQKYHYPSVVLSRNGEICVGSSRSVEEVDIHKALCACEHLLERFGGHRQAAGLTIPLENVEAFEEQLSLAVRMQIGDRSLIPKAYYDTVLPLSQVTKETYERIQLLEPCGVGNPSPIFLGEKTLPIFSKAVGKTATHLRMTMEQEGHRCDAISFGNGHLASCLQSPIDVIFSVSQNDFNNNITYQCKVTAIKQHKRNAKINKNQVFQSILQDLSIRMKNMYQPTPSNPFTLQCSEDIIPLKQGVLYVCYTQDTANEALLQYTQYDFATSPFDDPRAYSTILYGVSLFDVHAPYTTIILADGLANENTDAIQAHFPHATIYTSLQSPSIKQQFVQNTPNLEEMRIIYKCLARPQTLEAIAAQCNCSKEKVLITLWVFDEIELITLCKKTLTYGVISGKKASPTKSTLYNYLQSILAQ